MLIAYGLILIVMTLELMDLQTRRAFQSSHSRKGPAMGP